MLNKMPKCIMNNEVKMPESTPPAAMQAVPAAVVVVPKNMRTVLAATPTGKTMFAAVVPEIARKRFGSAATTRYVAIETTMEMR
jgi:hypothetical protein